ncbi:MAG: methylated-DNA--[protein]-cysteine S-methyltransferase [Acidimicrobiales bacterium]
MQHFVATVQSPVGLWGVEGTDRSITRVWMPSEHPRTTRGATPSAVAEAVHQLAEYFTHHRRDFTVVLEDVDATDFQREVWDALATIPYGEVRTYGDIARTIGRPRAVRAVGQANHVNPWPIIVPCHRVVAANGLGGYGGGPAVKEFLLALEQVPARHR